MPDAGPPHVRLTYCFPAVWLRDPSACRGLESPQRSAADHAAASAVHVDGHIAHHGDPVHQPILIVVVVDRTVLGGPVVPDGDITGLPVPPDRVLRHGDSSLQQLQKHLRLVVVQTNEAVHEAAGHQGAFTGLRMYPYDRMFGPKVDLFKSVPM